MNKKFIGILMTTAMLTTSFTGCGTDNIASGINQTQKDEDMKGKTEVDFWYSGGKQRLKWFRILLMIIISLKILTL